MRKNGVEYMYFSYFDDGENEIKFLTKMLGVPPTNGNQALVLMLNLLSINGYNNILINQDGTQNFCLSKFDVNNNQLLKIKLRTDSIKEEVFYENLENVKKVVAENFTSKLLDKEYLATYNINLLKYGLTQKQIADMKLFNENVNEALNNKNLEPRNYAILQECKINNNKLINLFNNSTHTSTENNFDPLNNQLNNEYVECCDSFQIDLNTDSNFEM